MTDQLERLAKSSLEALTPSDETLDRLATRVRADVDRVKSTDVAPIKAIRGRRSRLRPVLLAACLGAAALVFAVALWPGNEGTSTQPLTSAEAFEQAGDAAAEAPWMPLSPGEYHHTATMDLFVPQDPWSNPDERPYIDHEQWVPTVTESWLGRDGHGVKATITGMRGNDPNVYMTLSRNKLGVVSGFGWSGQVVGPPLPVENRLAKADWIETWSFPQGAAKPVRHGWYRQPSGYVDGGIKSGAFVSDNRLTIGEQAQATAWGNPMNTFDGVNDLPADELTDTAIEALLHNAPRGSTPGEFEYEAGDTYGVSAEQITTETRIARAVRLLGAAPLSPTVRAAIFRWLSNQKAAVVDTNAKDIMGRKGTRVTFLEDHKRDVPARTWTIEEITKNATGDGQPVIGRLEAKPTYDVKAYSEYRKWYVDVVFDERTGRLLQEASHIKWGTDGGVPQFRWLGRGANTVTHVVIRPQQGVVGSATAFLAVDRTDELTAVSTVCREHPKICR